MPLCYMDSLLRPFPPSHGLFICSFPNRDGVTPIKILSFSTAPAVVVFINVSGKLLLGPSLSLQDSPFLPKPASSFSVASSSLSSRRLVKAKQQSESGNGNGHSLKRHAGKVLCLFGGWLAYCLRDCLVNLFYGLIKPQRRRLCQLRRGRMRLRLWMGTWGFGEESEGRRASKNGVLREDESGEDVGGGGVCGEVD